LSGNLGGAKRGATRPRLGEGRKRGGAVADFGRGRSGGRCPGKSQKKCGATAKKLTRV